MLPWILRRSLAVAAVLAAPGALQAERQVPAGTVVPVRFDSTVSSATSRAEEKVRATVRRDVRAGDQVVIPAGSEMHGRVLWTRRPGRVKGRAAVAVSFHEVEIKGKPYRIVAQRITVMADDTHGRDAAVIGGSAGAGAIIGALKDGGEGAAKGGAVGAAAGTGVVLATRGKDVTLPAGTRWRLRSHLTTFLLTRLAAGTYKAVTLCEPQATS
jgi:hypothetical protein